MTRLAFYAPLKPPTHPTPSGDRTLARNLMQALDLAGFDVDLASELRLLDLKGNSELQITLRGQAEAEVARLIAQGRARDWTAWVTYHTYYKAPDLIGPAVAEALNLPYVLIEATRARKRLSGPWAAFAQLSESACDAADAICYFTQRDAVALTKYKPEGQHLVHLRPFLARQDLPPVSSGDGSIFSAGMMRAGDKLESYRLIADSLDHVATDWRLEIAGDGKARADVAQLMARHGARVRFLGALSAQEMEKAYARARVFLWPGVNEAIGLVYLEAQAAGLRVIAQDRPGVRDVLDPDGEYPSPERGAAALSEVITRQMARPFQPEPVRAFIRDRHLLDSAADTLKHTLAHVLGTRHG